MLFYFGQEKESVTSVTKKQQGVGRLKTTIILTPYDLSVTSVTKRDKRDILKTGLRAVKRDNPPYKGGVASRHPGAFKKIPERLLDLKAAIDAAFLLAQDLQTLKAEVLAYLDGYTSRGYRAEGRALARLRKAVTGNPPAPSPGSPGSPEREAEQRIRNERSTRMVDALARKVAGQ